MTEITQTKVESYERLVTSVNDLGLAIDFKNSCDDVPWGAYLRIADESLERFCQVFFSGVAIPETIEAGRLAPKILLVAPSARLSLQFHHRRSEHWVVLEGPVKVTIGTDAADLNDFTVETGEVVRIPQGKWHRLAGCGIWGRVAEIWEHTDPAMPSDEKDIVRVQDDYGR